MSGGKRMKKKDSPTTLHMVLILLLIIQIMIPNFAFADDGCTTIVIGGSSSKTHAIFKSDGMGAKGPWYPGYSAGSILRIENEYGKKITLNKIGMNLSLSRKGEALSFQDEDAQDYLEKMKIMVDYQSPLSSLLKGTIYDGTFGGFLNGADCDITIGNGKHIDLVYTIEMDASAEINVAGISGKADFTVNVKEIDSGNDDDDDSDKNPKPKVNVTDIDGHWAYDCIVTLLEHGIIEGYEDGTIRPEQPITRAEAAVLVGRALKLGVKTSFTAGYRDFIPDWAKGYVLSASEKNIFTGYPGKYFKPDINIARQEMVAVLIRGFEKALVHKTLSFTDKSIIGDWALTYVESGVYHGILTGYPDGSFGPLNNVTRAEAFVIICKLITS